MNFGTRLILFFALTLATVQLGTGVAIRVLLHDTLIEDGKTQVAAAGDRLGRQLAELEERLAEGVRLLTLDFALRGSIADHDEATVISVLRNHGRRIGAIRMLLIETDGTVSCDSTTAERHPVKTFPYPALLERAADEGRASTVVVIDGQPVWLVAIPIMAPDPIAFIAAALPLDDVQLARMRDVAGLPGRIGIATGSEGAWRSTAGTIEAAILEQLSPTGMIRIVADGTSEETIVLSRALVTPPDSLPVIAVIAYPVAEAIRHFARVIYVLFPALTLGLSAALIGAVVIARGVARPVEALARHTRRVAQGDYSPPPPLRRGDELGQLNIALGDMTRAIAEREARIRYQATHDPVTGLPNRQALAAVIDASAASKRGAVLVFGLIRWREITNTVGREIGDRLLREAGARVRELFTNDDHTAPIGSIGESSFAVFLSASNGNGALAAAARVTRAFDTPYREGGLTIDMAVAVGVSLLPAHGTSAAHLFRRAETALRAARVTESHAAVYDSINDPNRPERLSLMSDLRAGLTRGEFRLMYQPKLDLSMDRITSAEALVRWDHPSRGLVGPDEFIALAEETGNIQELTRWVLRAGISELARWHAAGVNVRLAINISVRDLADDTLPERVGSLLREFGVAPHALVLEVTESAIMGEPDAAIAILRRLADEGIDLAIDDFGVGQSSLAYLRRLPVREIKLDKAFLTHLPSSAEDRTIVRSVVELGHNLDYQVTAEGVEDAPSLALLQDFGYDHVQGHYISEPVSSEEFVAFAVSWHGPCPARAPT